MQILDGFQDISHRSETDASSSSATRNSGTVQRNSSCRGSFGILRERPIHPCHPFRRLPHRLRTRRRRPQNDARESAASTLLNISSEPLNGILKVRGPQKSQDFGLRSHPIHSSLRPDPLTQQRKTSRQCPFRRDPTPFLGGGSHAVVRLTHANTGRRQSSPSELQRQHCWRHREVAPPQPAHGEEGTLGAGTSTCSTR